MNSSHPVSGFDREQTTDGRAAVTAKWRPRLFWMACGLLGTHTWGIFLMLVSRMADILPQLSWVPMFLPEDLSLVLALPLVWLVLSGRLEGVLGVLDRRLAHPWSRGAFLLAAVVPAGAQIWLVSWLQTRIYHAQQAVSGPAIEPLPLVWLHFPMAFWSVALGLCIWRLAPGGSKARSNTGPARDIATGGSAFDLESRVARWRQELMAGESFSPENARELECHLRDALRVQTGRGLPPAQAFQVAARSLGEITELAAEFDRQNPAVKWRHRLFWMVAGLFGWHLLGSVSKSLMIVVSGLPVAPVFTWLFGWLAQLLALGVGWLLLRGKLEPLCRWLAPRLQTRRSASVLVFGLTIAIAGTLNLAVHWVLDIQGGRASGAVIVPQNPAAAIFQWAAALLWLPAWLIFLLPLPRLPRQRIEA